MGNAEAAVMKEARLKRALFIKNKATPMLGIVITYGGIIEGLLPSFPLLGIDICAEII